MRGRVKAAEPISRARIAEAALAEIDASGLERVTLRKVAARLGVGHGALYWHVQGKADLLDEAAQALIERALAEAAGDPETQDWRAHATQLFGRLRAVLLAHRDGAAIVVTSRSKQRVAGFGEIGERMMLSLAGAGFDARSGLLAFTTLTAYTLGFVAQEQATEAAGEAPAPGEAAPTLAAAKQAPGGPDAVFREGLTLILDSLARREKPASG